MNLFGGLLQVCNHISTILGFLETSERHLGTRNILFRILQILLPCVSELIDDNTPHVTCIKKSLFLPNDALVLVGIGIRETSYLT